jgi:long-chain acyl-CoA synthetase
MGSTTFRTLNELFLGAVERHAKPDAFLSKNEGKYEGLSSIYALQKVAALAVALERFGIRRGDLVAILSENRVEWPLTDYAVMGLGAIDVPIYPTLPAGEVEYILRDSEARAVVVSTTEQLQKILQMRPRLPKLLFVVVMDRVITDEPKVYLWSHVIQDALSQTLDPERDFRAKALAVEPQDVATVIYTSGTTGAPKGVILTHANIASNVRASAPRFQFTRNDRILSFLPLCHIFERMLEYFVFWHGTSIAYAESTEKVPENLLEARPTVMAVVPRVLEKVHGKTLETVRQGSRSRQKLFHWAVRTGWSYSQPSLNGTKAGLGLRLKNTVADRLVGAKIRSRLGGRLRFMISGSAPLAKELAEFFFAVGLPVYEGYGLTETSPVVTVNCAGAVKLGTVGRALADVEVKLGEAGVGVQGGEGKEILVRGPNVSPGYFKRDQENRESFVDGWFHTGDLGVLDEDGYLTITGRKKNLLKTSGGKYISPEKIEGLFQGHPLVAQMVVLGDSRHFVGALVVPNFASLEEYAHGRQIRFETREQMVAHPEVRAYVQKHVDEACQNLAPFERIRQIALLSREFSVDSGELSPTLKVRRFVVEERYREVIEEIYSRPAPAAQAVNSSAR